MIKNVIFDIGNVLLDFCWKDHIARFGFQGEKADRIAQAMNNVSGKILVVGYSDNVPIRSARFASNYELSLERARSVQKQLQGSLSQPERVKAEGRGEINPVAPNTTPENRARNRRVEITLLVSPDNTQAELNGLPQGN